MRISDWSSDVCSSDLDWHPSKTALEYLWRCGHLAVAARDGFQKVYDLTERALPAHHCEVEVSEAETVDWACRAALERLGVATSGEIAAFWDLVTPEDRKSTRRNSSHHCAACMLFSS